MKGITETRELVAAVAAIAIRSMRALDDGKFSYPEAAGFLLDIGTLRTGLSGVGEVPAELADLDDDEQIVLLEDIGKSLTEAGLSNRIADSSVKILRWAYGSVRTFLDIRNAPPSAILVAE